MNIVFFSSKWFGSQCVCLGYISVEGPLVSHGDDVVHTFLSFLSISPRALTTSLRTWRTFPMNCSTASLMTPCWWKRTLCWTWIWILPLLASRQSTATPWVETLLHRALLCLSRQKKMPAVSRRTLKALIQKYMPKPHHVLCWCERERMILTQAGPICVSSKALFLLKADNLLLANCPCFLCH